MWHDEVGIYQQTVTPIVFGIEPKTLGFHQGIHQHTGTCSNLQAGPYERKWTWTNRQGGGKKSLGNHGITSSQNWDKFFKKKHQETLGLNEEYTWTGYQPRICSCPQGIASCKGKQWCGRLVAVWHNVADMSMMQAEGFILTSSGSRFCKIRRMQKIRKHPEKNVKYVPKSASRYLYASTCHFTMM